MTRASVADFVDSFFINVLFQPDDEVAQESLMGDLAEDAEIV
jgi:hypothetical protein